MLRRQGTKQNIAKRIQIYFPKHESYIEPFFGAGGMFFNKSLVKYNCVNDNDSEVFNLFQVIQNHLDEFRLQFEETPIHEDLLRYWKTNKETEPIMRAVRFAFLSNYTLFGGMSTLRADVTRNTKSLFLQDLKHIQDYIKNVSFFNRDFRDFLRIIEIDELSTFIYADPPYVGTSGNYTGFIEKDSIDLFDSLEAKKCKWAMSEFNSEFILNQAKQRELNVIIIGERRNIGNRRTEILITNYTNTATLF